MPNDNNNQPNTNPDPVPPHDGNTAPVFIPTDDLPPMIDSDTAQTPTSSPVVAEEIKTDIKNESPADTATASGSAAPGDDIIPPTISPTQPKKKFAGGKGKFIATILGLFLLVGGAGAGVFLVQQNQNIQEKAGCIDTCLNDGRPLGVCQSMCAGGQQCANGAKQSCTTGGCAGERTCNSSGSWGACVKNDSSCTGSGGTQACSNGNTRCTTAGNLEVCVAGNWNTQTCSFGCTNGQCNTPPACDSNASCSGSAISGATSCVKNGSMNWCCPSGQTVQNGACATLPTVKTCASVADQGCIKSQSQCLAPGCTAGVGTCTDPAKSFCAKFTPLGAGLAQCDQNTQGVPESIGNCCVPGGGTSYDYETGQPFQGTHWTTCAAGYVCQQGKGCFPPATNPPGGGSTTQAAQCQNVKAYDTNWAPLTATQLSQLKVGDKVRFAVAGSTTAGNFTKARFKINNTQRADVTTKKPGSNEFYDEYTIPTGTTSFTVAAEIYHETLGWR